MSERKYAKVFHDVGNFFVWAVMSDDENVIRRDGISENNIDQFVKVFTDRNYHVTLFKLGFGNYFAEKSSAEVIKETIAKQYFSPKQNKEDTNQYVRLHGNQDHDSGPDSSADPQRHS